ncbi:hypothetical protein ACI78T_09140 [Blastococcus sp. SYSU D00922]
MPRPRELKPGERALLDGLLAQDFEGVAELREQVEQVRAGPGYTCGCGSIDLLPAPSSPASTAGSPVPAEGVIRDASGEEVGGLLLFLDAGRLSLLEVHSYGDPLPLPPVEHVDWVVQPAPLSAP